jgi:Domain of unknown function (DUF4338)
MDALMSVQGRSLTACDLDLVRSLLSAHPGWSRWRLSRVLCERWNWRNGAGQLKDMAARSLLLKLRDRGLITLPAKRWTPINRMRIPRAVEVLDATPLECALRDLGPLEVREVSRDKTARRQLAGALSQHHYLGYGGSVGENLQYTVKDGPGRLLACLVFGSSAWKCQHRDEWIAWGRDQRERNLNLTTNNTRFLILPWVRVPHLASWILGQICRQLSFDWQTKYGHPILLVETFVEQDRFQGTAYRAANWIRVGSTRGRSRQDRNQTLRVPVKDIYLYPLGADFRKGLQA